MYSEKKITIEQYVNEILQIFQFEPKNKYIAPAVDTDVSDDTDTGGNSTVYSSMQFPDEYNMGVMREDEENNVDMDYTDLDIVDQSFNETE